MTPFDYIKQVKTNARPKKQIDSEKVVERVFTERCKSRGWWAIKFLPSIIGLPDRIIFRPKAKVFFVELKTTGKKPTKAQYNMHDRLRSFGFNVYVIDRVADIDEILDLEANVKA